MEAKSMFDGKSAEEMKSKLLEEVENEVITGIAEKEKQKEEKIAKLQVMFQC